MHAGVSVACLYPMETLEALRTLASLGVEKTEIFFNTFSELKQPLLGEFKNVLDCNGMHLVSIHPFTSCIEPYLLFSEYLPRFKDGLDFYNSYFEAAQFLGADILILHGDAVPERISDEVFFERYNALAENGKKYGIRVAQENIVRHRSQSPEFIRKMRETLGDNAFFVLDIKQCIRSGCLPEEMADAMGDRIIHVHVNDNDMQSDCLLPGRGKTDYKSLLDRVSSLTRFNPEWIIEVYRKNFNDISEISESISFLKKIN